jgi:phosphoglycerate dehydrogenase-like enzyme
MPQGILNRDILLLRSHIMDILITTKQIQKIDVPDGSSIRHLGDLDVSDINEIEDKYDVIVGGFELQNLDFSRFRNLKLVQLISSGYDFVDLSNAPHITLANARGVYSKAIAEWTLSTLLFELKGLRKIIENQRSKKWDRKISSEDLSDKRILVFGTGSIGQEFAKIMQLFNVHVDGVNSNGRPIDFFGKTYALSDSKSHIKKYDTFIFCLPSTNETIGFIDEEAILLFEPNSIIVNVGRGDLIKEEALYLRNDIRFILDVHFEEPLPEESKLWNMDNILVSPHISFQSSDYVNLLRELIQINILNVYYHRDIVNRVK